MSPLTADGGDGLLRRVAAVFRDSILDRHLRIALGLLTGQLLGRGGVALYTVVLVRILTPVAYGSFAYALAAGTIAIALGDWGLSRLIIREAARAEKPGSSVRELLLVRSIPTVTAAALLALLFGLGLIGARATAGPLAAYVIFEGLAYGYESAAVGVRRPLRFACAQAVGFTGLVGAILLLRTYDLRSAPLALAAMAGASGLKLATHTLIWRKFAPGTRRSLRAIPWRLWLRDSLPFLGLAVLASVYYRIGIITLHDLRGAAETAPFAAASRVLDGAAVLAGVGFSTVSPTFSRAHRDEPETVWAIWKRTIRNVSLVAVPGAVALGLVAHPLARILFGTVYASSAGRCLVLLAPAALFMALQNITGAVIFMSEELRAALVLTLVAVVVTFFVFILLGSTAGATGTAGAMSIAEAILFTLFACFVRRRFAPSSHRRPVASRT